jgi:excisionase family DNA binding protein
VVEAIDKADADGDPLYATAEVAATLRVTVATIQRGIQHGVLPAVRIGQHPFRYLIRDSDLRKYLKNAGWR